MKKGWLGISEYRHDVARVLLCFIVDYILGHGCKSIIHLPCVFLFISLMVVQTVFPSFNSSPVISEQDRKWVIRRGYVSSLSARYHDATSSLHSEIWLSWCLLNITKLLSLNNMIQIHRPQVWNAYFTRSILQFASSDLVTLVASRYCDYHFFKDVQVKILHSHADTVTGTQFLPAPFLSVLSPAMSSRCITVWSLCVIFQPKARIAHLRVSVI